MSNGFKNILVTGAAGFIGFHLCERLSRAGGLNVTGVDNLNDYYDAGLKQARLNQLKDRRNFVFNRLDLSDPDAVTGLFKSDNFDAVLHMAAQAGVRYSLENPLAYGHSNLMGFLNILESCRHNHIKHLIFASSSSVYGANKSMPFSTHHNVDHPVSLYAATKKSNELMAHAYASLYGIACTGLRFFTVYGPWGRPDMAYFKFTKSIIEGKPIDVYNTGRMSRDFTYIDDVVDAVIKLIDMPAKPDPSWDGLHPTPHASYAPYRIYNIGNNRPVELMAFIETLEKIIGKKAQLNMLPMQEGDVQSTWADIDDLARDAGYSPKTTVEEGLGRFVKWYRGYYGG